MAPTLTQPQLVAQPDTTIIDKHGELMIRVGAYHEKRMMQFRVSAAMLVRASDLWRRMFHCNSRAQGPWLVEFREDDPDAMGIIFRLTHGMAWHVPSNPSIETLYDIIVVVNRYEVTRWVSPWASPWMNVAAKVIGAPADLWLMAMAIALELGGKQEFFDIAS